MSKHLFSNALPKLPGRIPGVPAHIQLPGTKTPFTSNRFGAKAGWVDTAVNVLHAGANLLGAPEEVTTVTQTVADATPSSFATSVASNTARGLWNTGKGLFTGDWAALKKQGERIVQGKEGAPLQGYGMAVELFTSQPGKMVEGRNTRKRHNLG